MKHGICQFSVAVLMFWAAVAQAQKPPRSDVDLAVGSTFFFGDLGGSNNIGRPLFFDLERSLIQPVGMLAYHYQLSKRCGLRVQAAYTSISGDDKLIQPKALFAPEWFRNYRNLDFHSKLWEISAQAEFYLLKYYPGDMQKRWGPYFLLGVGLFHFNPKTNYNGTEVALRPLHTEGQGFPGSDVKEYSLYQPVFPIGFGIRYNLTSRFCIGVEYADRKTLTDYMDDVSRDYVSQADFNSYFANDPVKAALAYQLSVRSDEIDPDALYSYVTAPGEQRGDPSNCDHYIFPTFSFCYVLGVRHVSAKKQMKCMKWGGSGGSSGVHTHH